ncbi:IS110 family transposase [Lichenicoccus sp.]|uniref:IS110 family transposase n=1 Tax=Lichenicoccus sp. TaxID=2781899 RepID=UPI003D150B05
MDFKRIAVDTSKAVFTVHGIDEQDRPLLRRNFSRPAFEAFCVGLPPTEVVLEACGGSHHWGRRLSAMGHRVRLIPPQYVKPFVKRGKNDRNDAEAISEAAGRPGMTEVAVKPAERQAAAMVLSVRELLVRNRTQAINALRGHAAEFGVIAAKGTAQVAPLLERIAADTQIPEPARQMLAFLARQVTHLDEEIATLDAQLRKAAASDAIARRLSAAPGIGPLSAITLSLTVDPSQFESGRHFAAWLGMVPRECSTGGKQRLGGISRAGNERLRQLLVVGAMAVIRHAKPGSKSASPWLLKLLERRPRKVAAVALANKMARVVWATLLKVPPDRLRSGGMPEEGMMARGEDYRRLPVMA